MPGGLPVPLMPGGTQQHPVPVPGAGYPVTPDLRSRFPVLMPGSASRRRFSSPVPGDARCRFPVPGAVSRCRFPVPVPLTCRRRTLDVVSDEVLPSERLKRLFRFGILWGLCGAGGGREHRAAPGGTGRHRAAPGRSVRGGSRSCCAPLPPRSSPTRTEPAPLTWNEPGEEGCVGADIPGGGGSGGTSRRIPPPPPEPNRGAPPGKGRTAAAAAVITAHGITRGRRGRPERPRPRPPPPRPRVSVSAPPPIPSPRSLCWGSPLRSPPPPIPVRTGPGPALP